MRVLITGSNGFIGHHVANYFKSRDCKVIGMGRRVKSEVEVDEYICCNMNSDEILTEYDAILGEGVDAIVHLAADMRVDPYTVEVVANNCTGTERLLQLCKKYSIPVFVQLSSLPVIGHPIEHPITESHPLDPYSTYHVTKVSEEMLATLASKKYGIRTASFRISAPIGIGVNEKTIFPTFVRNACDGADLILSGKGTRRQNYIHVRDISQALYKAIIYNAQGVYNLASYNLISNYDLAKLCVDIAKSGSNIIFSGKEDYSDDYIWDASIKKITSDIHYEPQVDIREAISEYINYLLEKKYE